MKETCKLIAVDMDGTLLQSDKTIHKDSIRDIQAAVEHGILWHIVPAGRWRSLSRIFRHCPW